MPGGGQEAVPRLRIASVTQSPSGESLLLRILPGAAGENSGEFLTCLLGEAAGFWSLSGAPAAVRSLAGTVSAHGEVSRLLEGQARRRRWPARGYLTDFPPPAGVPAVQVLAPPAEGPPGTTDAVRLWFVPFRWGANDPPAAPTAPPPEIVRCAVTGAAGAGLVDAPPVPPPPWPLPPGWEDEYRAVVRDPGTVSQILRRAGFTRGLLRALAGGGYVLANARPVALHAGLRPGDRLRVLIPAAPHGTVEPEPGELVVVFEDGDLLVVNKPPGLLVHPARRRGEPTLAGRVVARLARQGKPSTPRAVGRLDRGTSGLVVFARTRFCHEALARAQRDARVVKEYLAVATPGDPERPPEAVHRQPVKSPPFDPRRYREPRPARTACRVLGRGALGALVIAVPETGRTHQIRQHLAAAGMPLHGDATYGGACGFIRRPALHAWRMRFRHPVTGQHLTLRAPLPDDMRALIALLRRSGWRSSRSGARTVTQEGGPV